jgi:glycerophosphoryl diester phosphodiesterase
MSQSKSETSRGRLVLRILLMVLVVVVLFVIYRLLTIQPRPPQPYLQSDRPMVLAHRGGAALAPENTLAGFQNGVDLGADALELDVHTSADGTVVVIHDDTVDRTTDGTGAVHGLTLAELRQLDAGYRFTPDEGQTFPFRGQGVGIPTLEEVLATFPDMRVNIEIKQADPPIEAAVKDVIDRANARDRVLVGSEYDDVLARFRALAPDVATSAAAGEARTFYLAQLLRVSAIYRPLADAFQVPEYSGSTHVVTPSFVDAAHHHGVKVHVWTVNDAETMRRLLDIGVDGIITDRPDVAVTVVNEWQK